MSPAVPVAGKSWTTIGAEESIREGQFLEFSLGETPCFVFRRKGHLYGYRNRCPHLGITLNWLPERFMDSDNCFIHCATHGALFTPESGDCIAGPCQGDSLTPLTLRVVGGQVEVRDPSEHHG
ncbi:Ferredoxin subunit of nitrite reductase or a ring-hydroxylating dioxygenase [Marinobacter daqiaonensis]|uniref:Ferredoxin subunit of nitrite reductase or a ring-hydroxylating dioxygenase n=1 Tax=Marinobacter daqiaonensis TaxID=650891 RepID=A0A1I6JWH8_9GAMM|nr:Rieske (2Fe-2S) protein [Marinobacter daqiaonensis]SFR83296.1 Ferredoxin subunit of nitrite reductase or a ring-hydroxylating dioxygenase [Marinobacter daqiaonensis]